jgi:hypothetical protein
MIEQSPLPGGTDALDLIEFASTDRPGSASPVGRNRKPVRLIPQSLQKIQHRIPWRELKRFNPICVQPFPPGVAVGSLGDRDHLDVLHTEVGEDIACG